MKNQPTIRILVIDDDEDVCSVIRDFLEGEGYEVTLLRDPAKAIDTVKNGHFHLVLLDLIMPKINGQTLLKQLKKADSDICVIILTAYPTIESAIDTLKNNAFDYVKKPIVFDEFKKIVDAALKKQGILRNLETEINQAIGYKIRGLRMQRELTLKQLAGRSNLSVSLISQIERAESSASLASLYKICERLEACLLERVNRFHRHGWPGFVAWALTGFRRFC